MKNCFPKIEKRIENENPEVQWAMNFTAGWIGVYEKKFRQDCVALGERTGLYSKAAGKFYGDFLRERIFDPLGMTTAMVISEADIVPNRAAGYDLVDGELKNQEWVSPSINTTADGSLYMTALDMAKWEAGLNAQKLLKKESYEMMWSPVKLNDGSTHPYGFGWRIDAVQDHKILAHDGNWQGFSATIKRYPEQKIAVIPKKNQYPKNCYQNNGILPAGTELKTNSGR